MARYPTFTEYDKRGNYSDGIKRCDELLAKHVDDIQLLTTKLQFLFATCNGEADALLDKLVAFQPPLQDLAEISAIEEAVVESRSHRTIFPQPLTAGPAVAKLWETAGKLATSTSRKLDVISIRFHRAIVDSRLADAQQALIQLKVLQPKNRVVYMAHAALTQMLSTSSEDLQSRLALSLARKAVTERFDDEESLDCRVPGQIFAVQKSEKDLGSIKGQPFQESKQVFDALRNRNESGSNGTVPQIDVPDPTTVPSNVWLSAELSELKQRFAALVEQQASREATVLFATNAIRLFLASITSLSTGARRSPADACFLGISALVKLWEQSSNQKHLLHAAYLADMLLKHDQHIHEARLILVYLYVRLGLGSLAIRLFDSLRVKEVQHDTVGHALFTRLSITHPHVTALSKRETFDPNKRTLNALNVYTRCEDKLADNEASVLSHGQTGMIFDLQDLRDNLRVSLSRRITLLEQRRIVRLTKDAIGDTDAVKAMGPLVVANWVQTKDNRDLNAAFDYGYNVERALHGHGGRVPGTTWVLFTLAADTAWCLTTGNTPLVHNLDQIHPELDKLIGRSQPALGMSATEYLAGDISYHTLHLLLLLIQPTPSAATLEPTITALSTALHNLHIDTLLSTPDALAEHLSTHYTYIDVLRTLTLTCTFARRKRPHPSTNNPNDDLETPLNTLSSLAKHHLSALQQHAVEQQVRTKAPHVRSYFSQADDDGGGGGGGSSSSGKGKSGSVVYAALREFGEGSIEAFCEEVARSAKEGWEAVSYTHLTLPTKRIV